jgi:hypothetical protein
VHIKATGGAVTLQDLCGLTAIVSHGVANALDLLTVTIKLWLQHALTHCN